MIRKQDQGDALAPHWLLALPRLTPAERDLSWLRDFSLQLRAQGRRVSWAVPQRASDLAAVDGVSVYPAFDLTDAHDLYGPHADSVQHNVDGPRPFADQLGHVWGAFNLKPSDVCFIANARLSDLQGLWDRYAFTDLARAPVTVLRLVEFKPMGAQPQPSFEALMEELRWLAYRLQSLDALGKKILLWPASPLIAAVLVAAGLPCLPVHAAPKSQRTNTALLAFPAASRAEEELARRLRQSKPERHVESLPTGVRAAASRWLEGAVSLVYPAAVLDVDLLPTLARVQFQCPESHCVVVGADAVGGLPCVSRLSDAHRKLEAGSATDLSDSKAPNTTLTCAQLLEAVSLAMTQPQEPAPFVLHIAPAWAGAGSSHVFATQLEWLHECGFNVVCLHLDTDDLEANQNKGAVATRLRSLPGGRALHRWFLSRPAAQKALEQSTQIVGPYKYFSLEGEERVSRQVSIPDSLHQFLKRRKIHFVLLNYGHNWPMIDRLGLEATPIILETHDVRPVQHGLYNKAPTLDSAVAVEMEMFARASCAVFINDEEHSRFSEAHRRVPAVSAFPFRDQAEAIPLQSRFETPASTVLRALGLPFDIVEELFRPREQRRCRFAVFVGSTHKANVFSLDWFLTQVYPLGLMDPRLVILIVGTVGEALVDLDLPNVYCTGRLSDLQPVYAAADVILLPIRIGTGLPIKSLDALTAGAPFVATSAAISAVPGLVDAVGVFDSPEAFASRVMELAFDADAESTFRNNVKLLKQKSANWAAYTSVWGRALQGLALPQPLSVRCPPDAMNLAPFRESPAGPGGGEYYFWRGHGLTEIAGAEVRDHGIEILEPYSRLGLQCWTSGIQADRLRLSFLLRADAPVRCILALDGKVQGSLILQSDPLTVFLDLALTAGASCRSISLELRLEGAAAGFGAVVLSSLVARPSEVSILEASHV